MHNFENSFERRDLLKKGLLGAAGAFASGAVGGGAALNFINSANKKDDKIDLNKSYLYYNRQHPAGISEEPQRHTMFAAFKLNSSSNIQKLQTLLALWSAYAANMQAGKPVGTIEPKNLQGVPKDTGEAYGLAPAGLTILFGAGPSLFENSFLGLQRFKPSLLEELPSFSSDKLDANLTGGDLCIQACADDPQVVYHAIRNLKRIALGTATILWTQIGFGRASAGAHQSTPRNLFGFKDGTRNIITSSEYNENIWVDSETDSHKIWFNGCSYMIVRKIAMNINSWDADRLEDQQNVFGRTKAVGAPLTGENEFDTPDFNAKDENGNFIINPLSHMALASHENNNGTLILRRAYNYTDGLDNETGALDAGLLFICFQKDPDQFIRLQKRLGASDLLNDYIRHIGSGIFAVLPSPASGSYMLKDVFDKL